MPETGFETFFMCDIDSMTLEKQTISDITETCDDGMAYLKLRYRSINGVTVYQLQCQCWPNIVKNTSPASGFHKIGVMKLPVKLTDLRIPEPIRRGPGEQDHCLWGSWPSKGGSRPLSWVLLRFLPKGEFFLATVSDFRVSACQEHCSDGEKMPTETALHQSDGEGHA